VREYHTSDELMLMERFEIVKFLTAENSYSKIVDTIIEASEKVVLISPYIKIPAPVFDRLRHIDRQGIRTVVVCRGKGLDSEERSKLRQLKYLELRFDEELHAKCFYNENSMVITSLNLSDYSRQHNREMGILLSSDEDSDTFKEALREANFIVESAKKDSMFGSIVRSVVKEVRAVVDSQATDNVRKARISSGTRNKGFCIHCKNRIPYKLSHPYCPDCWKMWAKQGKDPYREESYCHKCGAPDPTTFKMPRCDACYRKSRS